MSPVDAAVRRAAATQPQLGEVAVRARALRAIASGLRDDADALVAIAARETALTTARLEGELTRTSRQLEAFALAIERHEHLEPIIDHADAAAVPPRPDLRLTQVPIGPVAVFEASNFPLAFGVCGGDTAAALAAGCAVVVRIHPVHPETSRAVAAIAAAGLASAGLPADAVSVLDDPRIAAAEELVDHPLIEAVAFTGSRAVGRIVHDRAARRPRPIPVFAEMGSVNPVVVLPAAAAESGEAIATQLASAVTASAGQLCTKPGLIFVCDDAAGRRLADRIGELVTGAAPHGFLSDGIARGFADGLERLETAGVPISRGPGGVVAVAAPGDLDRHAALIEEHFGPCAVIVLYQAADEVADTIRRHLHGELTATLRAAGGDEPVRDRLAALLVQRVGRLLFDGVPTGLAVGWATHHGGPYPATSAPATTSVGMTALRRFLRPVCFQDAPDDALPPELKDDNPLGLRRRIDGVG